MLASDCILVKGFARVALCDLQYQKIYFLSHKLSDKLINYDSGGSFTELNETELRIIDELIANDCIVDIDNKDQLFFPQLSLEFNVPSYLANFILDISYKSKYKLKGILDELELLLCRHIELRFFDFFDIKILEYLINWLENSIIESVDIYAPYSTTYTYIEHILKLKKNNSRLRWFFIHTTPENFVKPKLPTHIQFTTECITDSSHCGVVNHFYFANNIAHFTEAQLHNTCLNRKIAIDVDGNIKNCPSMPYSYGNIKDTTLKEALEHPDFKKYWYIHKDQIEICKDCEFRYICTDCRAYLEDPDNLYSKPLKCGYNPYTCEWEEWSTNPLKQKAIEYYGMQELVKQEPEEPRERATK